MSLFGGVISISGITFLMFSIFVITALGYALGRITIKGVSLGTAGVFIVALLYGAIFSKVIESQLMQTIANADPVSYSTNALKIVENIGLILFVTSVGFIAGPNFFKNLKQNYKSYIVLGLIIILAGAGSCIACFFIGKGGESDPKEFVAMLVGLLSGSLTSTPAFSAAKATVLPQYEDAVTVGHGIAYLFGVIGVVLFVQLIPKLTKANMEEERKKIQIVDTGKPKKEYKGKLIDMDGFGFMAFALAAFIGIVVGSIKIPLSSKGLDGTTFSLTTTGGTLITALIFGHFGHIGPINVKIEKRVLEVFREFGLMLFLIGAGVAGGAKFVQYFKAIYFVYGIIMTIVPMVIGFLFAKYVLKLSLLNNLGSITGGMTSTPALGTLINVAGTDDVASAYAATYPIALIAVVVASQLICTFLG
ncbi:MAG: permease [Acutalibacteraceae bacterium]